MLQQPLAMPSSPPPPPEPAVAAEPRATGERPPERARFVEVPTRPMHSVPAEADGVVRLDALVTLLIRRGVLAEEEYPVESVD